MLTRTAQRPGRRGLEMDQGGWMPIPAPTNRVAPRRPSVPSPAVILIVALIGVGLAVLLAWPVR